MKHNWVKNPSWLETAFATDRPTVDSEWLIGPPAVYQDLGACNGWPVKNAIVWCANQVKENFETHFWEFVVGAQKKEIGAAFQTLLGRVR